MSKYQFQQSDIYQPGTDLPINRLNIDDAEILHEIEAQLLQQAYQTFVSELTTDTRFDEAYFQSLHQRAFDSLYAWAGQYRTQDMVKGGSMFCRELEKENFLSGSGCLPLVYFVDRLGDVPRHWETKNK